MELNIIYKDQDVIVINKPAGILVHPTKTSRGETVTKKLLKQFPELKGVGEDQNRPGIVHRLDKDTSGILIIARNQKAFKHLKNQFKKRLVQKTYLVLVHGVIKDDRGRIEKGIKRSQKSSQKRRVDFLGKEAITNFKVIRRFKDFTLIKAYPKTGRTHQIRVHLASIGHPVAGDKLYKFKRQKKISNLSRQFLHAQKLKITLPSGKPKIWISPLPKDLKSIINTLNVSKAPLSRVDKLE